MRYQSIVVFSFLVTLGLVPARSETPLRSLQAPSLPPMFEENRGQFPAAAKYLTRRNGYKVAFASGFAEILAGRAKPARRSSSQPT
jgi:hypothetical protein